MGGASTGIVEALKAQRALYIGPCGAPGPTGLSSHPVVGGSGGMELPRRHLVKLSTMGVTALGAHHGHGPGAFGDCRSQGATGLDEGPWYT